MSDNMEREKNERTAREIEEEKMKRELTDIGIYEPRFTYQDMKQLLGFINESKAAANITLDNKNASKGNGQHSNECLSEMISETDGLHEQVQERADMSRSMYSYRPNRTSPTATYERKNSRYSSSPEGSPIYDVRNSVYRRKSSDSDETMEKQNESTTCAHNASRFKLGNASQEACQNAADVKTVQNVAQSEHNQRLERWRLNPFDVCINENDVPLQQPSRSPARERVPLGYCKELTYTSEQRDQKMQALSQHLRDMADLWYSWHRPTDSKFQWGSPIQVGTANGSLDRKPLTEPKTELIKVECTYKDSHERASKRRAYSRITSLQTESSDDEDAQYAFDRIKKKRLQSSDKLSNVDHVNHQPQTTSLHETRATSAARQRSAINDDGSSNTNNEDTKFLHCRRRIEDVENDRMSPELTTYPRRIIPPTPKTRLTLSKCRKGNVTSKPSPKSARSDGSKNIKQAKNRRKDDAMTEEVIRRRLETNSDEEMAEIAVEKDTRIRSPMSREMNCKLQEKQKLTNINAVGETRSKERESGWQWNTERKSKFGEQRKNEENLRRTENKNVNWNTQLLDDEDSLPDTDQESDVKNGNRCDDDSASLNSISCPICNKLFPPDKIENHAADCDQFQTINEDEYVCSICDDYKTADGTKYEDHVHHCINSRRNKMHSYGSESVDIVSIPSSFHTYETSEQKAASSSSQISDVNQLPSHSRTRVYTVRKKKH